MAIYAETRRDQYTRDVAAANDYYRLTGDLAGYQTRNTQARESWHADILAAYHSPAREAELKEALANGGRVYADTLTGDRVRVHNIGNLYAVTDTTGAPAMPLIGRMVGDFIELSTSVSDLVGKA